MTITTTTHLNLRGTARQALEFYQSVFGGQLTAFTYADFGGGADSGAVPSEADLIVWGQVESPEGFRIMAFDMPASRALDRGTDPFFESLRGTDADEITAIWEKLSVGSTVIVPLAPAAWSPLYGMLTDPFGVTWVVDATAPAAG
ncbi:VOC family protein [Frigoribacterium sp. 2-23]|uniref:VOC family protein n=1 Tax=Frigoribacterium sp. 2-23 TaxID=3415006 RepID=UPI003C6F8B22